MGFPSVSKDEILKVLGKAGIGMGEIIYVAPFASILGNRPNILEDRIEALVEEITVNYG